jgi:hypothetical protein
MKFGIKRGEAIPTEEWFIDIGFRQAYEMYGRAWRFRFVVMKSKKTEDTYTLGLDRKGIRWQSKIIWHPLSRLRMWLEKKHY